jgi:hypothetical protein
MSTHRWRGAAVVIIHSYAKETPQERACYGLRIIFTGILLGILPVIIALVFQNSGDMILISVRSLGHKKILCYAASASEDKFYVPGTTKLPRYGVRGSEEWGRICRIEFLD